VQDDTAEFVKRYLTSVCESTDVPVDYRIEAGELLRKHEAQRVMSEIIRPNYRDDDNVEAVEPLSVVVARRRAHCDKLTAQIEREMGLRPTGDGGDGASD
jgi:hypothetical protein